MVRLSELITAEEIHQRDLADPAYRAEHERTRFANDVAIRVLAYRTDHGLTQTAFGKTVGLRQPQLARLEAGEHEPVAGYPGATVSCAGGGLHGRHSPWRCAVAQGDVTSVEFVGSSRALVGIVVASAGVGMWPPTHVISV